MALTAKQQAFVDAYAGNATDAARKAGYSGNDATLRQVGHENMMKPDIAAAIAARQEPARTARIATREQRQVFWSETMLDPEVPLSDRLRASELLGKSEADFLTKIEHTGKFTLEQWLIDTAAKKGNPT